MSFLKQLKKTRKTEASKKLQKARLIVWRKEPSFIKVEYPTKLDRAKSLGYKAKQGVIIVRARVPRGGKMRPRFVSGRRSKHRRRRLVLNMNYQTLAEQRTARKYPNMEVLNSYYVGKDGKHYWFEIILIDLNHPSVLNDQQYAQLVLQTRRVFRGLTSSAKKSRGLRNKGKGAEKVRPSKTSNIKRRRI